MSFRISKIHVAICADPGTDEDGVPAILMAGVWTPLIAADEERVEFIRHAAAQIAEEKQLPIRIVRFSTMETVETISPAVGGMQ